MPVHSAENCVPKKRPQGRVFLLREVGGVHRRARRGAEGQRSLPSLVQGDIGLFINVWAALPDLRWAARRWRCRCGGVALAFRVGRGG